jgi:hypothetical protein
MVAPVESSARYKYTPLALDPDVGLIQPPAVVGRFELRAQTAFHFRGVALHPPPHGDVIGVQAAISEQFLYVSVRKREAQIPADGPGGSPPVRIVAT